MDIVSYSVTATFCGFISSAAQVRHTFRAKSAKIPHQNQNFVQISHQSNQIHSKRQSYSTITSSYRNARCSQIKVLQTRVLESPQPLPQKPDIKQNISLGQVSMTETKKSHSHERVCTDTVQTPRNYKHHTRKVSLRNLIQGTSHSPCRSGQERAGRVKERLTILTTKNHIAPMNRIRLSTATLHSTTAM